MSKKSEEEFINNSIKRFVKERLESLDYYKNQAITNCYMAEMLYYDMEIEYNGSEVDESCNTCRFYMGNDKGKEEDFKCVLRCTEESLK